MTSRRRLQLTNHHPAVVEDLTKHAEQTQLRIADAITSGDQRWIVAGSVALIGFGAESAIEVISAVGLQWRLRKTGPRASVSEESAAEKRALYVVAITFFLLALYITWEAVNSLISLEEPLTSPVGIILALP